MSHVGMLRTQALFQDGQDPLTERLCLAILALISVEERQVMKRTSHVGMLWSYPLFPYGHRSMTQTFGLAIACMILQVQRHRREESCGFPKEHLLLFDLLGDTER